MKKHKDPWNYVIRQLKKSTEYSYSKIVKKAGDFKTGVAFVGIIFNSTALEGVQFCPIVLDTEDPELKKNLRRIVKKYQLDALATTAFYFSPSDHSMNVGIEIMTPTEFYFYNSKVNEKTLKMGRWSKKILKKKMEENVFYKLDMDEPEYDRWKYANCTLDELLPESMTKNFEIPYRIVSDVKFDE